MFSSENKAQQNSERRVDSEQNRQNKPWHTLTGGERYELQSVETDYINFNAGSRVKSKYIPPVNTVLHGGRSKACEERGGA